LPYIVRSPSTATSQALRVGEAKSIIEK